MSFVKTNASGDHIRRIVQVAGGTVKGPDGSPVLAASQYAVPPADGRIVVPVSDLVSEGQPVTYVDATVANGVLTTADGRPVTAIRLYDTIGVPVGAGLATPVLANFSAAGAAPLVLTVSSSDYVAGFYGQLQVATDNAFASIVQNLVFFIDGDSWARLDKVIGLTTPSGLFYARARILRENEAGLVSVSDQFGNTFLCDASNFSATYTDTINVSVNVFTSATGGTVNKSQYIANLTAPYLSFIVASDVGSNLMVRGMTAQAPNKGHWELVVGNWFTTNADSAVYAGVCDSGAVTTFTTFGQLPGFSSVPGCSARLTKADTNLSVNANGVTTGYALGVTAAVGDAIILEVDKVANTVKFYYWDASAAAGAGALVNAGNPLVTVTLTGVYIPAAFHACAGGRRGDGTAGSDRATANFGGSAFLMTPTTGYAGW